MSEAQPSPDPPVVWWRRRASVAAGALAGLAVTADLVLPRTGLPGGPFLGRFHPLVVHLPVGLVLVVALAEAASFVPALRRRVDPGLGLLLGLFGASAAGAFVLGHLLAHGGSYPEALLTSHRRLTMIGVLGSAGLMAAWSATEEGRGEAARLLYRVVLALTLLTLSLGAHHGGSLTHGEAWLSKHAPSFLAPLLGARPEPARSAAPPAASSGAPAADPLLYAQVIAPLVKQHCEECHGPEKSKGKLRSDTVAGMLAGGEGGPAIKPGDGAGSLLVQRMLLPADDDERMPPDGEVGPTPAEIETVRFWIDRGASETLKVREVMIPESVRGVLGRALGPAGASPTAPAGVAGAHPVGSAAPAGSASAAAGGAAGAATGSAPATPAAAAADDDEFERELAAGDEAPPEPAGSTPPAGGATPAGGTAPAAEATSGGGSSAWDARIGPLLVAKCAKCHGEKKKKGALRLDSLAALQEGGSSGPAVVAGKPEKSLLVTRCQLPLDHDDHMPPPREPQLTADELAALSAWVRAGANAKVRLSALPAARGGEPTASAGAGGAAGTAGAAGADTPGAAAGGTAGGTAEGTAGASGVAAMGGAGAAAGSGGTPGAPPAGSATPAASAAPGASAGAAPVAVAVPARIAVYRDHLAHVLAERCLPCHSEEAAKGGLDVTSVDALLAGGEGGPALVPGKPDESPLYGRVVLPLDDVDHMPPSEHEPLSPGETELLRAWIAAGGGETTLLATAPLSPAARAVVASRSGPNAPPPLPPRGGCGACAAPGGRGGEAAPWIAALGAAAGLRRRWTGPRRRPRATGAPGRGGAR